jgi:hypothetical protein
MQGFKCNVTGASSTAKPLAKAQAPVYCEREPEKCVKGAKQMLAWRQATGNNIEPPQGATPNYNQKCGWAEGAQTDIFEGNASKVSTVAPSIPSSTWSTAIMNSGTVSPSTLTTRVTSVSVAPTPDAISITSVPVTSAAVSADTKPSCTARRPRYAV